MDRNIIDADWTSYIEHVYNVESLLGLIYVLFPTLITIVLST